MIEKIVILGQGYVGLPLAKAASASGLKVYGFDIAQSLVDALNDGRSHIDDLSDRDLEAMIRQGYEATSDPLVIKECTVAVICVPTPLSEDGGPDLGAVIAASRTISAHMSAGITVVLESTTYPGTTEDLVLPILEESGLKHGVDFQLAFSPERVDPGSKHFGIENTPKLIGGLAEAGTARAAAFYSKFIDMVVPMSGAKEAETAKLLENTYRHVNIALMNEMAKFCHDLDIDIWEVIRGAATKPFGFQSFTPGPGVGGHCIPIDPNYLSFQVKRKLGYSFKFVELAQEINNSMPRYVVERIAELLNAHAKAIRGSSVLILGVTYKANISDQRESPAIPIAELLMARGASVTYYDPSVDQWSVGHHRIDRPADYLEGAGSADLTVLLQAHAGFDLEKLAEVSSILFDTRGVVGHGQGFRL